MVYPMQQGIWCVGIATQDHIFAVDRMPDRGTKFRAAGFQASGGGVAATAAVAVARLGGQVALLTRLGDDAIGEAIVSELQGFKVDCAMAQRFAGTVSSISAIMVDPAGERMIVNYMDPTLPDGTGWLPEVLPAHVAVMLADTRWIAGSLAMLTRAKAQGRVAMLDGDMPGCPPELVAAATLVAFSAGGLREVAGTDDIGAGLVCASAMGDGLMMATDGANGVFWLEGGRMQHFPAFPVLAVDSLGAGDVFHGALALALAEGQALRAAVRFASAAAAIKVTRFGGRTGAPVRHEVEAFLSSQELT